MALAAQIQLSILAHETSSGDISRTLRATPANYALTLTNGTGANQAQVVWSDSGTVSDTQENELILDAATDDRGAVAFSSLKLIYFKNTGPVALRLFPNADWTGSSPIDGGGWLEVPAGGVFLITDSADLGWSVGSGAGLVVQNASNQNQQGAYDIVLIGEGTVT